MTADREAVKAAVPANACRWCDQEPRGHGQLWTVPVGWHSWEAPSDGLRKLRLLQRRASERRPR